MINICTFFKLLQLFLFGCSFESFTVCFNKKVLFKAFLVFSYCYFLKLVTILKIRIKDLKLFITNNCILVNFTTSSIRFKSLSHTILCSKLLVKRKLGLVVCLYKYGNNSILNAWEYGNKMILNNSGNK